MKIHLPNSRRYMLLGACGAAALAFLGAVSRMESTDPMASGIRAVAALFLVLGVFLLSVNLFKRWARGGGLLSLHESSPIEVRSVKPLGEGRSLLLVEVQGELLLLGATKFGITMLRALPGDGEREKGLAGAGSAQ
jgi:flagellar biogenesis protein FliO